MINVVFVAPFFMRATVQFLEGAASLNGIRFIVISKDSGAMLPADLREKIHLHVRLDDVMNPSSLEAAIRDIGRKLGPIHRLLGTLEQLQVPLGQIRDHLNIAGMGADTAENFRNKSKMKQVLRAHGLPCARHCLATSRKQAMSFAESVGFPLVVKPPAGAGGKDTFQIDRETELVNYLTEAIPSSTRPILFEEFIMGNEHTFDSVIIDGETRWHSIVRYFPTPLQALKNPWIQWCVLLPREIDHPYFDDIRTVAASGLKALGMKTGLSHMEWFRRVDGSIALSEVGARPPGGQITSMHGYAHDFDIHRAWAELMVFDRFPQLERKYAAGTVFLRGQGKGRVRTIRGLNQIKEDLGSIIVEAKLPNPGQPASSSYEGEGYLILRHPQTSVVEKALDLIINTIRIELN